MTRIPSKMAERQKVFLSAGKHNKLVRAIVEEFCPRFVARGKLLYVRDAETKQAYLDDAALEAIGVSPKVHGDFPDVVALDERRKLLFLIEAASGHAPAG